MDNPLIPSNPLLGVQYYTVYAIIWQRQLAHNFYANRTPLPPRNSYDFIVVGAGAAGSIVACRLSQWGKDVLLLEAGGAQDALLTDHPGMMIRQLVDHPERAWPYYNEPQAYAGRAYANSSMSESKGKLLGGSSSHNYMYYVRGNRRDYDNLVKKWGAYGWSYDQILPFFKKTENNVNYKNIYHANSGPISVRYDPQPEEVLLLFNKAINEQGYPTIDVNGATQIGGGLNQHNINKGLRAGPANAFLESGICPKLTIVTRALVTKVVMSYGSDGLPYASAVDFSKEGKTYCVTANKEVIVSAGPIASPQLLMLSGIGHQEHLRQMGIHTVYADLPVGDNLCNHIGVFNNALLRNYSLISAAPALEVQQLYQANVLGIGPLAQVPNLVFGFVSSLVPRDEQDYPDVLIEALAAKNGEPSFPNLYQFGERIDEWKKYLDNLSKFDYLCIYPGLFRPKSRGTVRLRSNNPTDIPVINPNFLVELSDREAFMEIVSYSFYLIEKTSFSKYAYVNPTPIPGCNYCPNKPVYLCKTYLKCFIQKYSLSLIHPTGTISMGDPSRPDVVVDPRLRVKGVKRLRVIDSSIYPDCINANTNAASMLAGEKGADLVYQDHS